MTYLGHHILYYRKGCPKCQRVLSEMDHDKARLRTCDVSHPNNLRDLIELTGRRTVPCLIAHGKAIYGEEEIIGEIRGGASARPGGRAGL